ncbi:MAG TPA: DUF4142 domain-containing protein [Longimicrobium sp.]
MDTIGRSPARRAAVGGAAVLALTGFATGPSVYAAGPESADSAAHHALLAVNVGEVEEGRLALDAALSPRVRDFARMMVDDHGQGVDRVQLSMMRMGLLGRELADVSYNRGSNAQGVDQRGRPIPENNSGSPNGSTGFSAAGTDLNRDPGSGRPIIANNGEANGVAVGSGSVSVNATRTGVSTHDPAQGTPAGAALGNNGQLLDRNGKPIPENNAGHPTGTVGAGQSLFAADAPQPASAGGDHPGGKPATAQAGSGSMAPGPVVARESTNVLAVGDPRLHAMLMSSDYSRPIVDDHMAAMQRLQGLRGVEFDRAYMDRQVAAHEYALRTLDNMLPSLRTGASIETVRMTTEMRAAVVRHLALAQQVRDGLR